MFELLLVNLIIRDCKRDVKQKTRKKRRFLGIFWICVLETTARQGENQLAPLNLLDFRPFPMGCGTETPRS